jgi:dolichol kinase
MANVILCLIGAFALLVISESLYGAKILKPEDRRKFVHITVGSFIASWPWLISWRAIQILGLLMFVGVMLNRRYDTFKFSKGIARLTYGEYFFALAVTLCAMLTTNKIFFAIAILQLALADGFAAIAGKHFGKGWKYKVFGQDKTVIGTMTFWIVSLGVLSIGILFAHNFIPYNHYYWLILLLPPALTVLENISVFGLDDAVVPVVTILALRLAQS